MFTVALDASISGDGRIVCVAGFMAQAKAWQEFSALWQARIARDQLDYFHMHEFVSLTGQFKDWDAIRRRKQGGKLIEDLVGLVKDHAVRKFGTTIVVDFLSEISPENQSRFMLDKAYPVAARRVAGDVANWGHMEKIWYLPRLVFEDGDFGKGDLRHGLNQDGWPDPAFEPKRDRLEKNGFVTPGFIPLQAADMIAHTYCGEARDAIASREEFKGKWRFHQFEEMPGTIGFHTPQNLREMNETLTIIRQLDEWTRKTGLPVGE